MMQKLSRLKTINGTEMNRSTSSHLFYAAIALCVGASASVAQAGELGLRPSQSADATPSGTVAAPADTDTIDWNALNWDPSKLTVSGHSAFTPTTKTFSTGWDTKAGIDTGATDQGAFSRPLVDPEKLLPGAAAHSSSGAAWASVTAPALDAPAGWDKATIDARFDSLNDERKLGTTISKSVPLNDRFSVTLQNGYSMTQSQATISTVTGPGTIGGTHPYGTSQSFSSDNMAKLNLLPTGTSLSVGTAMSTIDEKWLRSIGAEQKLFDGISVKGSVSETATGAPDRSISAGFKRNW